MPQATGNSGSTPVCLRVYVYGRVYVKRMWSCMLLLLWLLLLLLLLLFLLLLMLLLLLLLLLHVLYVTNMQLVCNKYVTCV